MKPVWKKILIYFFSVAVLSYIVLMLFVYRGSNGAKICHKITVILPDSAKIQLISQKEIISILEKNDLYPVGKSLKEISTENIEDCLHKNPMIEVAECWKTPSGNINIKVLQRIPKYRVIGYGSYYIDINRKPMPVSRNCSAYVPVVSGKISYSMACGAMFDFVNFLESNPFWNDMIEQINVLDDGKIELITRVGEARVLLGTLDNYESKLNKLKKLYSKGFNVLGWNRYKLINLEYKDQVVCSKELYDINAWIKKDSIQKETTDSIIASKI